MSDKLKRVKAWQCTFCGDIMLDAEDMEGVCEDDGTCPALAELKKRQEMDRIEEINQRYRDEDLARYEEETYG